MSLDIVQMLSRHSLSYVEGAFKDSRNASWPSLTAFMVFSKLRFDLKIGNMIQSAVFLLVNISNIVDSFNLPSERHRYKQTFRANKRFTFGV